MPEQTRWLRPREPRCPLYVRYIDRLPPVQTDQARCIGVSRATSRWATATYLLSFYLQEGLVILIRSSEHVDDPHKEVEGAAT
jgi:hypothetical protein